VKIRAVKTQTLKGLLLNTGFEEEKGRDHIFYFYKNKGKIIVRTKISHGVSEVRQPILGLIGKQLHLDRDEFESFLAGKLPRQGYEAILRTKGIID
jgi:hypothetical protein